ncbi:oxidoreductase [Thermosporothrix hazakensis]|uniref:Oxidoreductase n=1 Tax=Thermosporothrix sp. COM3 TaxID=2490863 RepID=A0A455SIP5_9CHLR|nr:oxidoreductase [Thermosporothrix sp. COM3]GCE46504.1 oxidoreductase [Thermosporothrix hazakensis]
MTGATGFIGSHLVRRLVEQGERPRCLVRDVERARSLLPGTELVQGDTTRPETLPEAVQGVDTIVHCAFVTADRKQTAATRYYATNVEGTDNLIKAAKEAGVRRMIELSGLGTKPDKPGSYMQGRYLAEQALTTSGLDWTIVRPSVVFGKGAPFISGLVNLIRTSPVLPLLGGGKIMFQPIFVEDVVSVVLFLLEHPEQTSGRIYTIGGPEYYSFEQILDLLTRTMGKKRLKVPAPLPFVALGAAVLEAVLPKPPLTREAVSLFTFDNTTALDSVERDFFFIPVSFRAYLQEQGV